MIGTISGATIVAAWALVARITVTQPDRPDRRQAPHRADRLRKRPRRTRSDRRHGCGDRGGSLEGIDARRAAACLIPLVPALVLTNSRGAWLACAAGLAVGLLVTYRRRAEAVAVSQPPPSLSPCFSRFTRLSSAVATPTGASPVPRPEPTSLTGSGAGTFAAVYAARLPHGPPAQDAHSLYLETLDELGLVGLALLLAGLLLPLAVGLCADEALRRCNRHLRRLRAACRTRLGLGNARRDGRRSRGRDASAHLEPRANRTDHGSEV